MSNWTPVEGEKIVYTYKASNDPVSCSHSLQRSQLLVSNYRYVELDEVNEPFG